MKTFELRTWMTENRETVISKYNDLTKEEFFNGITLKDFMLIIYKAMSINNPKSDKRAASLLPTIIGNVYFNNSKIDSVDAKTNALRAKYEGTVYMALV